MQAYALVTYLNSIGHNAKLIDYRQFDNKLISTVKSIPDGIIDLLTIPAAKRRIDRYNDFRRNVLTLTPKCKDTNDLQRLNRDFDAFITGSDQVWNIGLGVCKDFYLEFAEESKKRISYAASFGVSAIPDEYKKDTVKGINNIQNISVREESGRKIVAELTGRDASVVLDPVFLLDAEQWKKMSRRAWKKGNYIFVYPTQITPILKKIVRQLKEKTGLQAISPFYVPGCKSIKDIGPCEFVDYIADAEYIVASSFHATAFSMIFNKKLIVIPHSQTGTRTTDLLNRLEIGSCIVSDGKDIKSLRWDYTNSNEIMERYIKESKDFLKKAL